MTGEHPSLRKISAPKDALVMRSPLRAPGADPDFPKPEPLVCLDESKR